MGARLYGKGTVTALTTATIKDTYAQGTKVEAIKVKDVPSGMTGIVRGVDTNGKISVIWKSGEITDVEFGIDSIKIATSGKCMLRIKPQDGGCQGKLCEDCGWNDAVHKKRVDRIRNGGMVRRKTKNGTFLTFEVNAYDESLDD